MAISTFTPVEGGSTIVESCWNSRLFSDRYRAVSLPAGNQLLIENFGKFPVFITAIPPVNPADLMNGFPVAPGSCDLAIPYVATIYVCFPFGDCLVAVNSGALTANNAGPVEGPELVTNGNFAQGSTGWTLGTGWTVANGLASKATGSTADLSQAALVPTPGATYRVRYTLNWTSGVFMARIGNTAGVSNSASGNYVEDIVATNSVAFAIRGGSTAAGSVTNLSVKQLT